MLARRASYIWKNVVLSLARRRAASPCAWLALRRLSACPRKRALASDCHRLAPYSAKLYGGLAPGRAQAADDLGRRRAPFVLLAVCRLRGSSIGIGPRWLLYGDAFLLLPA